MRFFNRHGGWSKHVERAYRSGLEDRVSIQLKNAGVDAKYERGRIPYLVPSSLHHYTPDFVLPNGVIVETKGLFEASDRHKHLLIQAQYPHLDIRFVFSNPYTKLYKGAKTTYADWCDKHDFIYANKWIPESWWQEEKKDITGIIWKEEKKET